MHPLSRIFSGIAARFGASEPVQTKAAVAAPVSSIVPHDFFSAHVSPVEITPVLAWNYYKNIAPFAKVVDLIADSVASLTPLVQVNGVPVDGHPVSNFLMRPGFNRTRRRFIKELTVQYLVTGTAYVHAIGNPAFPPVALDVLKTKFLSTYPGPDMWPDRYLYAEGSRSISFQRNGNPRDPQWVDEQTALAEIIPIYDMDGDRRGIGLPRLNAIRSDIELRLKGIVHNTSVLDKGARLSGILSFRESMTPEQEMAVQQAVGAKMSGAGNAGGVMVTSGGQADFNPLSQSMKDMDFAKLIGIVEDAIASRYNVPVTLFRTEAQTNNNYETAWNVLYDNAILPTFQIVYSGIAQLFAARFGEAIDIVHDSLTAPILARAASARARELFASNLISRNEARQLAGYEPVLGGDIIYGPMGMVPQGEDLFTAVDQALGEDGAPEKPKPRVVHMQQPGAEPANDDSEDDDESRSTGTQTRRKPARKPERAADDEGKAAFGTLFQYAESLDRKAGLMNGHVH